MTMLQDMSRDDLRRRERGDAAGLGGQGLR